MNEIITLIRAAVAMEVEYAIARSQPGEDGHTGSCRRERDVADKAWQALDKFRVATITTGAGSDETHG